MRTIPDHLIDYDDYDFDDEYNDFDDFDDLPQYDYPYCVICYSSLTTNECTTCHNDLCAACFEIYNGLCSECSIDSIFIR